MQGHTADLYKPHVAMGDNTVAHQWWIQVGDIVSGPFTPRQIRELAEQGKLWPGHLLSRDRASWVPAANVKGLTFAEACPARPSAEHQPATTEAARTPRRRPLKMPRPELIIAAAGGAVAMLGVVALVWFLATPSKREVASAKADDAAPGPSASSASSAARSSIAAANPNPLPVSADDLSKRRVRLAIVTAVEARHSPVEDLLLTDVSNLSGVEFLDREHLAQVMNEQKISIAGLTTPEAAIRAGQLLSADALVLVEPEADRAGGNARVKIVETRDGVRLTDRSASVITAASRECLLADVRQCVAKLRSPVEKRRYVVDIGFRCEEPSRMLAADANALGVLIEQDLAALPTVMMLERDPTRQLAAEQVLAGLAPRLRSAAVVLEGGVQRDGDGQNLLVSIKIVSAGHEEPRAVHVQIPRGDIFTRRKPVIDAIGAALGSEAEAAVPLTPADEAALLGGRAEELRTHGAGIEAASLCEAAFALAPSRNYFSLGQSCYLQTTQPPPPQCDRLRLYLRGNLFAQRYLEWSMASESHERFANSYYAGLVYNLPAYIRFTTQNIEDILARDPSAKVHDHRTRGYGTYCGLEAGADEAEVVRLAREIRRVQQAKWDIVVAERRRRFQSIDDLLLLRLVHSATGPTPDDAKDDVIAALAAIDKETSTSGPIRPVPLGPGRPASDRNTALCDAVTTLVDVRWHAEKVLPLLNWMTNQSDPVVCVMGLYGKTRLQGLQGQKAADELLAALSREPHPLDEVAMKPIVLSSFGYGSPETREKWLQILPKPPALNRPGRRGAVVDLRPHGDKPRFWSKYRVRPVSLDGVKEPSAQLVHFVVDPANDGTQGQESITMLWDLTGTPADRDYHKWKKAADDVRNYILTRLRPGDGQMTEIARFEMIELIPRAEFAVAPRVMFFNPREHGLAVLRDGKVRYITEAEGLPFAEIATMAWLDGRLYLGAPGALARFDPDTMHCELLASSRAVAGKSELDGGNLWYINSMLPDPKRHCLWVSIDTDVNQRTKYAAAKYGLWKFNPADGSLRKANPGTHGYLTWSDGRIFFLAHGIVVGGRFRGAYGVFDPQKEEIEELSERLEATDDITDRPRRALVNGDVITGWRYLCTTNGSEMLPPPPPRWDYVTRFGPGVLTCTLAEGKMWYIDARPAGEPAATEAADESGAADRAAAAAGRPRPPRVWHITGMPPVEAGFVALQGGFFILEKPDGGKVAAPIDRLSKEDRDYIQQVVIGKK